MLRRLRPAKNFASTFITSTNAIHPLVETKIIEIRYHRAGHCQDRATGPASGRAGSSSCST